ncbi:MAG: efflux RND transporter periplasmic adaptor subunit [Acidobacteriota bacterium]
MKNTAYRTLAPRCAVRRAFQAQASVVAAAALLLTLISSAGVAAQERQEPPPMLVVTAPVTAGPISNEITLAGTTRPTRDSLIASEIEGRVIRRLVENGDRVEAAQALVEVDAARLKRALQHARAELHEVLARLGRARRQEKRAIDLHESKVLPLNMLDDARSEREALEGRQAMVESSIASIQDDLERTTIRAPFDGVVTEIHTEVGEWIKRGDDIVRLADFDPIEIILDLPERYYRQIESGDRAPATLDALPGLKLEGSVFAVVPRTRSAARNFPVLVRAPNPEGKVGAGMLARVHLVLSVNENVLQVPRDAIVRQPQGDVVFRVEGERVKMIPVQTGRTRGERIEVTGDLSAGQPIVVRGNERLMPGQKIRYETNGARLAGSP